MAVVSGGGVETPGWPKVLVQPDLQRSYACSPNFMPVSSVIMCQGAGNVLHRYFTLVL